MVGIELPTMHRLGHWAEMPAVSFILLLSGLLPFIK